MAQNEDGQTPVRDRKFEHIELATKAQVNTSVLLNDFQYEPLFSAHPSEDFQNSDALEVNFLHKKMKAPIWISSMTGGTGSARHINQNLARVAGEFGLGMGLGSCRPLLEDEKYLSDFQLRPILGNEVPFYANLGIAQVEESLRKKEVKKIEDLVGRLDADGLIVHINPLQEFLQEEGDRFRRPPIDTLQELLSGFSYPVIVKEVGQGMGPRSLRALMQLPLGAIEFAAFGGTNFAQLEMLRGQKEGAFDSRWDMALVGHTAEEMITLAGINLKELGEDVRCRNFIVSGGIRSPLHGFALTEKLQQITGVSAVYGQAKSFLDHAHRDYDELQRFVKGQLEVLSMAKAFLKVRKD